MIKTFRNRLTLAMSLSTAIFLFIFCLGVFSWSRNVLIADINGDLQAINRAELASNTNLKDNVQLSGSLPKEPGSFTIFEILLSNGGDVISSTEENDIAPGTNISHIINPNLFLDGESFAEIMVKNQTYRILGSPNMSKGEASIRILGISCQPMKNSLTQLGKLLASFLILGTLLAVVTSIQVAKYLTAPLKHIIEQLEEVTSAGNPSLRVKGTFQDLEIKKLKSQINAMLEKLEQSFKAQHRFMSDASHELRSPLSNLTLAIDVCLRRKRKIEEYLETLDTCRQETRRLTEMTNSLLTLSEINENGPTLNLSTTNIANLVSSSIERFKPKALDNNIIIDTHYAEVVASVDDSKLLQVLDNLLDNALRHAPPSSVIKVSVEKIASFFQIKVCNAGANLTSEQCSLIFERFYRTDSSRQRKTGGTGLGLAICKEIIQAHGGKITAESKLGSICFIIKLPLLKSSL